MERKWIVTVTEEAKGLVDTREFSGRYPATEFMDASLIVYPMATITIISTVINLIEGNGD